MKKILGLLILALGLSFGAMAQDKVEVKKTSTPAQKVHNTFSKHKHYKGYKVKKKRANGHKTVHTVNHKTGEVKDKSKHEGDVDKKVSVKHQ